MELIEWQETAATVWRLCLALVFLSAAVGKWPHREKHVWVVRDYRLLPERWVRGFAYVELAGEFAVGLLLLLGWFSQVAALAAVGLLLVYTGAVSVNLLRGRREISCGCGGVVGEHSLSWWLVLRNLVFAALTLWAAWAVSGFAGRGSLDALSAGARWRDTFDFAYWGLLVLSCGLLAMVSYAQEWGGLRRQMKGFLEAEGGQGV